MTLRLFHYGKDQSTGSPESLVIIDYQLINGESTNLNTTTLQLGVVQGLVLSILEQESI